MTSATIESALIVSPSSERALFSNRAKFELVVMYDASSVQYTTAMSNLARAIFETDFTQSLKRPPVLLVGGLEAWKGEIGEEGSHSSSRSHESGTKESPPMSNNVSIGSYSNANSSIPQSSNSVSIISTSHPTHTPPSSNVSVLPLGHERWVPPRPQSRTEFDRPISYSTQTPNTRMQVVIFVS